MSDEELVLITDRLKEAAEKIAAAQWYFENGSDTKAYHWTLAARSICSGVLESLGEKMDNE
jgi:hypothetical protein